MIPYTCGLSRPFSGAVAGEAHASKSTIPSTRRNPYLSHYIICHLPLVFLSPTSPLSFYSPSLSILPLFLYLPLFACSMFACVLDCLLVTMAQDNTKLSPENEILNFKQREGENLKDAWYRICNAQNRSTRKQSIPFFFAIFM